MKTFQYILLSSLTLAMSGCGSGEISKAEVEGTITDVIDGNTVELNTGTQIHLQGVDADNTFTKEYMESHYVGREVYVNIGQDDYPYISSYDDDFDGYVILASNDECINRTLLSLRHEAFDASNMGDADSLNAYRNLVNPDNPKVQLDDTQLAGKMKAGSMLVFTNSERGTFLGTAFLINKNGLALTNYHVVRGANQMVVYTSDSRGNIRTDKAFGIKKMVESNADYDYALFYVDFDEDTRGNLNPLPLVRLSVAAGNKVAAVGNPAPGDEILPMRFATGKISSYNDDDKQRGQIGIDVAITNGFSGGPLCNYFGEVVGISKSGYSNNNANLNFAVDIQKIREWLDDNGYDYEGK